MKFLVNKNALYIITHDDIDVESLQDRGCLFFLTERDMNNHAAQACGLAVEELEGSAFFIGFNDECEYNIAGLDILEEDTDIITTIAEYDI